MSRGRTKASNDDDDFADLESVIPGDAHASDDGAELKPRGRRHSKSNDDDYDFDPDLNPARFRGRTHASNDDEDFADLDSMRARGRTHASNDDDTIEGYDDVAAKPRGRAKASNDDDDFADLESVKPTGAGGDKVEESVAPRGRAKASHDDDDDFADLESVKANDSRAFFDEDDSVVESVKLRGRTARTNASEEDDAFEDLPLRPFNDDDKDSGSFDEGSLRSERTERTYGTVSTLGTAISALSSGGISKGHELFASMPTGTDPKGRTYYFNPMTNAVAWTAEELTELVESSRGAPDPSASGCDGGEDEDDELAAAIAAGAAAAAAAEVSAPLPPPEEAVVWQSPGARARAAKESKSSRSSGDGSRTPRTSHSSRKTAAGTPVDALAPATKKEKSLSPRAAAAAAAAAAGGNFGAPGGATTPPPKKASSPRAAAAAAAVAAAGGGSFGGYDAVAAPPPRKPTSPRTAAAAAMAAAAAEGNASATLEPRPRKPNTPRSAAVSAAAASATTAAAAGTDLAAPPPRKPTSPRVAAGAAAAAGEPSSAPRAHVSSGDSAVSVRSARRRARVAAGFRGGANFTDSEDEGTGGSGTGSGSEDDDEAKRPPPPPSPLARPPRRRGSGRGGFGGFATLSGERSALAPDLADLVAASAASAASTFAGDEKATQGGVAGAASTAAGSAAVGAVRRGRLTGHGWFALELFDAEGWPASGGSSGLYLDVAGARKRRGADLIVWPKGGGAGVPSSDRGGNPLAPLFPSAPQATPPPAARPAEELRSGDGAADPPPDNQLWRHDAASGRLVSAMSVERTYPEGLVVDVKGGDKEPGARLITWDATGKGNQAFGLGARVAVFAPLASLATVASSVATAASSAAATAAAAAAVAAAVVRPGLVVELQCVGLAPGSAQPLLVGVRCNQRLHAGPGSSGGGGGPVSAGAEVVTVHPAEASFGPAVEQRAKTATHVTQWRVVPVHAIASHVPGK